jgi:succinate-acetate transporter protein
MSDTIDAIHARLSPGRVVSRATAAVTRNPVPLALMGLALTRFVWRALRRRRSTQTG